MENNADVMKFLYWEKASRDTIDFKKSYVDLADDLIAGLLLSQIVYWHLPSNETGKTKLRVKKENHLWIAKGRNEWWDEIRITGKQFDRASNVLVKKGLIEKKTFKFNGNPTSHTRLLWENFIPLLENIIYEKSADEVEEETNGDMVINQRERTKEASDIMVIPQTSIRKLPEGEERSSPNVNKVIPERSISLTESTEKITKKSTTENLSISENEKKEKKNDRQIDDQTINNFKKDRPKNKDERINDLQNIITNKDLPIPISKPMMMNAKRMIKDNISLEDIENMYFANKDVVNDYQFGNILANVLYETKGSIRNIRGLLHTAIKNYFQDINGVQEKKENIRTEVVPDWFKRGDHLKGKPETEEEPQYDLKEARNRFNDVFDF